MSDDDADFREWDAAYLLGALSPSDRTRFEEHLAHNPSRAADVAELAGLPGLLRNLTVEEAIQLLDPIDDAHPVDISHQAGTYQSLAHSVNRRRRRFRAGVFASAIVAAVVLVSGSLFVGARSVQVDTAAHTVTSSGQSVDADGKPMVPLRADTITADLRVTQKPWGTLLSWNCRYTKGWVTGTRKLDIVITTAAGNDTIVGTWTASGTQGKDLAAATSIPTADIRSITVRPAGGGGALLRTITS